MTNKVTIKTNEDQFKMGTYGYKGGKIVIRQYDGKLCSLFNGDTWTPDATMDSVIPVGTEIIIKVGG